MELSVNQQFQSYTEFNSYFQSWCHANFCVTRHEDSRLLSDKDATEDIRKRIVYKNLLVTCVHYGKPISRHKHSGNGRQNTKSLRRECTFSIRLKYNKTFQCLYISDLSLNHNHRHDEMIFKLYPQNRKATDQEMDAILKMVELGADLKAVIDDVNQSTGSQMKSRDIYNYRLKRKVTHPNDQKKEEQENQQFRTAVDNIRANANNEVHILVDKETQVMECLVLVAGVQKEWYANYANIIDIDATYRTNYENYVLFAFLVQDQNLNGLPVAFAFMRRETNVNMEFMFRNLTSIWNTNLNQVLMVDKDLQNLDLLKKYFSKSKILICTFHVIKYMRSVLSEYVTNVADKRTLMNRITDLVYAKEQNEVDKTYLEIRNISEQFYKYLEDNWRNCEEMWIQFHRERLNIFCTHTNNHIESFNRKIKRYIKPHMHLSEALQKIVETVNDYKKKQESYTLENLKSITHPLVRSNNILLRLEDVISFRGMFILKAEMNIVNTVGYTIEKKERNDSVTVFYVKGNTENSSTHRIKVCIKFNKVECDCTTFYGFQHFCRHIIKVFMSEDDLDIKAFIECINIRWRKTDQAQDKVLNNSLIEYSELLAQRNKEKSPEYITLFLQSNALSKKIAEALERFSVASQIILKEKYLELLNYGVENSCLPKLFDFSKESCLVFVEKENVPKKNENVKEKDFSKPSQFLEYGSIVKNKNPIGRPRKTKQNRNKTFYNKSKKTITNTDDKDPSFNDINPMKPVKQSSEESRSVVSSEEQEQHLTETLDSETSSTEVEEKDKQPRIEKDPNVLYDEDLAEILDQPPPPGRTDEEILKGFWLTDVEINKFLDILREQFPKVKGLEKTQHLTYRPERIKKHLFFTRIVFSNNNHWVCVTGGGYENEDVCLFDSRNRTRIDELLGKTVKKFFPADQIKDGSGKLSFRVMKTQKQKSDLCGFFAAAFATALVNGYDPEWLIFDQSKLCSHFLECIKNNKVTMFPYKVKRVLDSIPRMLLKY